MKTILILLLSAMPLFSNVQIKIEPLIIDFLGVTSNNSSIIVYGNGGLILKSNDSGYTWEQKKIFEYTTQILKMKNRNENYFGITNNKSILFSTDNGNSWEIRNYSRSFYDLDFYEDNMVLLSDSSIIFLDKNFNERTALGFSFKIIPKEFIVVGNTFVLPSDTGQITIVDIKDQQKSETIDFKKLGLCSNCAVPRNLKESGSDIYVNNDGYILKSPNGGKNWSKLVKSVGIFDIRNDEIFQLEPKYFNISNRLTSPTLYRNIDTNLVLITKDTVKRYVKDQSYIKFRFISDSIVIAVGFNKTIYISRNSGKTWDLISNIVSANKEYWKNKDYGVVFVNNGQVFTTKNGGVTWKPQLFTDSNIVNFSFADLIYLNDYGNCFVFKTGGNMKSKTNIMLSNDSGETFVQYNETKINENNIYSRSFFIETENKILMFINSRMDAPYCMIWTFDKNFNFVSSDLIFESLSVIDNSIERKKNEFSGYGFIKSGFNFVLKDTSQIFSIYSKDGIIWSKEYLFTFMGRFKGFTKASQSEILISVQKYSDSVIIDSTGIPRPLYNESFILRFHINTKSLDTVFKSRRDEYPAEFLNFGEGIYTVAWDKIFSINKNNLSGSNWDSISTYPYKHLYDLYSFSNIAYFSASSPKSNYSIIKISFSDVNSVNEQTEISTQLYNFAPYPIPADNKILCNIYWDSRYDINFAKISVYDIAGSAIASEGKISIKQENAISGDIVWDCHDEPNGIYFISITHGDVTRIIPVVVNR